MPASDHYAASVNVGHDVHRRPLETEHLMGVSWTVLWRAGLSTRSGESVMSSRRQARELGYLDDEPLGEKPREHAAERRRATCLLALSIKPDLHIRRLAGQGCLAAGAWISRHDNKCKAAPSARAHRFVAAA